MNKSIPSIFNDVLGPVMRGPSSSHSAAGNRIGRLCRDLVGGDLAQVVIEYDPNGSLVTTHTSQGTDMGLYGGFLGWLPDDPRLPDYLAAVKSAGLGIEVRYVSYGAAHPNTYKLKLTGANGSRHAMLAISTGGGMIEVLEIDGCSVSLSGDFFETLIYIAEDARPEDLVPEFGTEYRMRCGPALVRFSSLAAPGEDILSRLQGDRRVRDVRVIRPVIPVMSRRDLRVPFQDAEGMLAWNAGRGLAFWELAAEYEAARGGLTREQVLEQGRYILGVIQSAIKQGLGGTTNPDRLLPCQSVHFVESEKAGRLLPGGVSNRIIAYISAIMEVKSAMGVIVAAPTAGSCGAMPGSLMAVADALGLGKEERIRALLTAGLIGVFIVSRSTFSAEVGGCMAECGSAAGMAAAAMVGMAGGTIGQQLAAASLALQNSFGMTCDPVANRVEAPCLAKNVLAGSNAFACANMALANYQHLIPLDEVIEAMDKVGRALPRELRCTGKGGLSMTPTSIRLGGRV